MSFPQLSSAQLASLRTPGNLNTWGLTLTFTGLTLRAASVGFNAATLGAFQGIVKSWSPIRYSVSDRGGSVPACEVTVSLTDYDRTIANYCEGIYRKYVVGGTAVIQLMSPIAPGNWLTLFTGVVADRPRFTDLLTAELVLRTDDGFMQRQFPRSVWRINVSDFPHALPSLLNQPAPIVYGRHSSRGWTDYGFVPLMLVDTINFYYLVTIGRATTIENVYINKQLVGTSNWTYMSTLNSLRGGKQYSMVSLTTTAYQVAYDATNPGSTWAGLSAAQKTSFINGASVTADVQGVETGGDGLGTLIENPMSQLAHFLTNFVFGDWRSGYWLSQSTRLDATSVANMTSFFNGEVAGGHRGSRRIAEQQTASTIISDWLTTWQTIAWWTNLGKLAFGVVDPTDQNHVFPVKGSDPSAALTASINDAGLKIATDGDRQVRRSTTFQYVRDATSNNYLSSVTATDQGANSDASEVVDMSWGPSE